MTPEPWSRREMLRTSARCGLAGMALSLARPTLAEEESRMRFRIGACDWTLGKRSDLGSFAVAKEIGLDGVQVDVGNPDNDFPLFKADVQQQFLEESKKQEVAIASLAMGVLNNVPYKSDPRPVDWVAQGIDAAKAVGVDVILLAFFSEGDLRDDPKGKDEVVKRLAEVAPKAENAGVSLAIESWLSAEEHVDIIDRVGSPAIKVYYDVGNSNHVGHDIYEEIRFLGDRICEFHAKDYDDLYGKGSIDFKKVRAAMDDIGYSGWINMEGIKMPLGVEESCRYDLEYLRTVFSSKV
ncbi:MAG: sugar phosphate isomerase/epimerase [Candidatus Omnitrophica bacterium]|nr:sugar phosphate isomerase/epimerase [Candidatus Omnitrophota bacterium]